MASVDINAISKKFGTTSVLNDINVNIADGEFVVLVGPSGCGKSTLLRMIAGLETVDEGEIHIGENIVNWLEPKERDVAMVFQNYALYPHMTVFRNMAFSLKIQQMAAESIGERVASASGVLSLDELLERFPRQLSGGQRQRVAMGRAIVRAPRVFLFDEPLSNLDARLRVKMRTEIKALHARLATTAVYVTHDQVEAMTMADRIVVMSNGNVEQVGSPLEIYDNPTNTFVAEFIGSPGINLIHGTVKRSSNQLTVETDDGVQLPLRSDLTVTDGQPIIYGIRPEHIALGQMTAGEGGFSAPVELIEPTGAETLLFSTIGGVELCARTMERHDVKRGDMVSFKPDLSQVLLFEQATGERRYQ